MGFDTVLVHNKSCASAKLARIVNNEMEIIFFIFWVVDPESFMDG